MLTASKDAVTRRLMERVIELEAENAALRQALTPFAHPFLREGSLGEAWGHVTWEDLDRAAELLGKKEEV